MARSKATINYKSLDDVDEFKKDFADTHYPSLAELCAVQPMTRVSNCVYWLNYSNAKKSDKA